MKRSIILLIVFMTVSAIMRLSVTAATDAFYCEYTKKTNTGTVFYIDVYSREDICSAVMELSFDKRYVEFRSADAVDGAHSVRSCVDGAAVNIAFASSEPTKGNIIRTAFKAINTGSCCFKIMVSSAADASVKLVEGFRPYTLNVVFDSRDVEVPSSGSASVSSRSSSKVVRKSGDGSYISGLDDDHYGESSKDQAGGFTDLRGRSVLPYIFIGAGGAAALALIALMVAMLLKRRKKALKTADGIEDSQEADFDDDNGSTGDFDSGYEPDEQDFPFVSDMGYVPYDSIEELSATEYHNTHSEEMMNEFYTEFSLDKDEEAMISKKEDDIDEKM